MLIGFTVTAWLLALPVALAYLWAARQLPRNRTLAFIGLALLASFCFDTAQLWTARTGHLGANQLIGYAWPMVTGILLLFGLARMTSDAMAGAAMILILGFLLGVSATSMEDLVRDGALIRIVAATIVAWVLAKGLYHRSGLEVGVWIYYLIPAPALVAGVYDPSVAVPVFWFARSCQLLGLLVLGGWLFFKTRVPSGLPRYQSSSALPSPSAGASPEPWTSSVPTSSASRKPTPPYRGSPI